MKQNIVFGSVGVIALLVAAAALASDKRKSEEAFDRLASLQGEWKGEIDGVKATLIYMLTADGSALMEQFRPEKGPEMITMFTVDGDHLIATHYCAAKNQPQMVTGVPSDLDRGVTFSLERVTGMKTPEDWHNTGVTLTLDDKDHMTQRWTYLYKGKTGTTVFHYTRKK